VLLAAMIPIGRAMETTGGAESIANGLLKVAQNFQPEYAVVLILVSTMFLSDIINNAAAAILMAPIALRLADGLSVAPDPFLMAVAVGASCAFLTIGHQTNTVVYGPGGYKFGDFWRLGLPLEILIVAVGTPAILTFWPLHGV
jgi:di/tricarboxylate transporter